MKKFVLGYFIIGGINDLICTYGLIKRNKNYYYNCSLSNRIAAHLYSIVLWPEGRIKHLIKISKKSK